MTLYNRPRAEVFADNAPPSEIQPFQAWLRGLGIAFDETNGFPEMTGLNGLFNALNQYIKYLEQNGFAEWSSSIEYPVGAGVRVGSTWYRARTRNTNKPPATSQNDWAVFLNGADIASASTTVKGIVQLSNVLNSTSTSLALTAAQGKVLQDNKLDKSGGTVSGILTVDAILRSKQYLDLGYGEGSDAVRGVVFYGAGTTKRAQIMAETNGILRFSQASGYSFDKTIDADISGNAASATNASNVSRSIVAGNGLSGGGVLNANRTITLGTPSTITASTANSTTGTSHTHNLDIDGFFQGTKSTNGYQRLPGGLILQWGTVDYSSNPGEIAVDVVFPLAFPTSCLNVTATRKSLANNFGDGVVGIVSQSRSSAKFQFNTWDPQGAAGLRGFTWFAIGY